ncbi:MAG: nucleotide exchange factor GrpE [bacterium]|nr:nucleotide exchange factor GrpE [bacterium]
MKIPVKTGQEHEQEHDETLDEVLEEQENLAPEEEAPENPVEREANEEVDEAADNIVEFPAPEAGDDAEDDDEITQLQKQVAAKEQEAKEHYDARLRLQAEFDNFKKRKEKEAADFRKYANEDFLKELLVVVDDFDRAIAAAEQTHKLEDFLQGVEMIFEKFISTLKKKGVSEIEAEGQPFNPEIHEAVTQIETDEMEEGTVAAVFQKGYYLHDRVVIAPKVGVAKNR